MTKFVVTVVVETNSDTLKKDITSLIEANLAPGLFVFDPKESKESKSLTINKFHVRSVDID